MDFLLEDLHVLVYLARGQKILRRVGRGGEVSAASASTVRDNKPERRPVMIALQESAEPGRAVRKKRPFGMDHADCLTNQLHGY